jgi:hypothetical protein
VIWGRFRMEARDPNGITRVVAGRPVAAAERTTTT